MNGPSERWATVFARILTGEAFGNGMPWWYPSPGDQTIRFLRLSTVVSRADGYDWTELVASNYTAVPIAAADFTRQILDAPNRGLVVQYLKAGSQVEFGTAGADWPSVGQAAQWHSQSSVNAYDYLDWGFEFAPVVVKQGEKLVFLGNDTWSSSGLQAIMSTDPI